MNIFHTAPFKRWLLPAFVAACIMPAAHADTAQQPSTAAVISEKSESVSPAESAGPRFSVLEDRLYQLSDSLTGAQAVHYYGFVAQRGQDVLINVFNGDAPTSPWKVEYYESGGWVIQTQSAKVFSNLAPGAEIIIRVMPRNPENKQSINYALAFGSYPVLQKYDLHDEPGVIRIPVGRTVPGWLATQIYKEALLEVKFTDTKGAPLSGGVAYFHLEFDKDSSPITAILISDESGSASKKIELGRCYGGRQAADFVHNQRGFNTWRSYYRVGAYATINLSQGGEPTLLHQFYLGHICTQTVLQTVRPRN
jgi:hypothetical protein